MSLARHRGLIETLMHDSQKVSTVLRYGCVKIAFSFLNGSVVRQFFKFNMQVCPGYWEP